MNVKHCPRCGCGEIDKHSYSAEYMSSTRWTCEDCGWSYKRGRGMGTGSGNKGTHPREYMKDDVQTRLVETGEWCYKCETCAKPRQCRCDK